jgi:four helix bundle protein
MDDFDQEPNDCSYQDLGSDDLWVGEESSGPTRDKSRKFALSVISLYQEMVNAREFVISKQLLRCGTSIGANVEEAIAAESRRDFLHKMTIASKEARESVYWLGLLEESRLVADLDVQPHLEQANELVRLLTSIVKTTKQSISRR